PPRGVRIRRTEAQGLRQVLRRGTELALSLEHQGHVKVVAAVAPVGPDRLAEASLGQVEVAGIDGRRPALGPGELSGLRGRVWWHSSGAPAVVRLYRPS